MKIGILTFHRALNHGAFLQCFALKTYLEQAGHLVEVIDYWPKYHEQVYRYFKLSRFKKSGVKYLIVYILTLPLLIIRKEKMIKLQRKYLGVGRRVKYPNIQTLKKFHGDCVIYGSDQIWWKNNNCSTGYDLGYWGDGIVEDINKVSYAASMGVQNILEEDTQLINQKLSRFIHLSVREDCLKKELVNILDKDIHICLDPTFLIPKSVWLGYCHRVRVNKPFLLLMNLLNSNEAKLIADKIASEKNMEIVELTGSVTHVDYNSHYVQTADAFDFISYIKEADFIVTSSFHCTVFSILFEKEFISCGFKNNAGRVQTLLSSFGIEDRLVMDVNDISIASIDYDDVNKKIERLSSQSKDFLLNSLIWKR